VYWVEPCPMYTVFTNTTKSSLKLPPRSNLINYSLLSEYYCKIPFRSFSIKYVSGGYERYTINDTKFKVASGEYILANNFSNGAVEIESKVPVTGLCIDLAPELLTDVVHTLLHPDVPLGDLSMNTFFDSDDFFESKFKSEDTHLGKILLKLDLMLSKNPYENHQFDSAFYFHIAEQIVKDYTPIVQQLQRVEAVKSQTRKDLFRKVSAGYDFLNKNFAGAIDVPVVAAACGLSEYYFYRLFKSVYGQSPMQFVIRKRLSYAHGLMKQHRLSVTEAATACGFADIHSFSKAFRKQYGSSPTKLMN
jgi:AraC family transcriptional regulator